MKLVSFVRNNLVLICPAAFAFCWLIARACIQSVVIDEADSYMLFAAGPWPGATFFPSSGNHVLNTLLVRLSTSVFGLSEVTLRIPAIAGGAIYICSSVCLCLLLTSRKLLQWSLFVSLVYNPFIFDFLVAARGYSLAVGFLLAAVLMVARSIVTGSFSTARCVLASIFVALSFCANFSFAFVDAVTIVVFLFWALYSVRGSWIKLAAACLAPGILVASAICGWTVWNWPKGQLYYGATSLMETWNLIVSASFYELSPVILAHLPVLQRTGTKQALALLAVGLIGALLANALVTKPRGLDENRRRLLALAAVLSSIVIFTLLVHFAAFRTVGLLLPQNRTSLFFVPLAVLALGALIAMQRTALASLAIAVLIVHGVYFIGCLRLEYFQEWEYNADTKQLYGVLDELARRCGPSGFVTEWRYVGALNFYRRSHHSGVFEEFTTAPFEVAAYPADKKVYVLYEPDAREFIRQQRLKRIYFNSETNAVIATRDCAGPTVSK